MRLYHFSENPNIGTFTPRRLPYRQQEPAMVWTIDEDHAYNYYFPRDCPRVCYWLGEDTSAADRERFFGHTSARHIVAVESGWHDRIRQTTIYRYAFDTEPFQPYDGNAGYYVALAEVVPAAVEPIDDLLGALLEAGVEVRLTPSLEALSAAVAASSANFSMIRMANAAYNLQARESQ